MKTKANNNPAVVVFFVVVSWLTFAHSASEDYSPPNDQQQLPKAMHSAMKE